MTLEEFHQSLTASEPPAELTLALLGSYGGMLRATGREPTSLLSRTKGARVRGFTPIYIAKRVIRATQSTGMVGRESLFAENRSMRNGSASREICWNDNGT
jgi:hypothetical protein